jgi:hypothetical protein
MRALLIVLAACTELPAIERGVCGNQVRESGELCDTFAPEATECGAADGPHPCAFVCLESACPEGWSCGTDGRCRLADGRFAREPDVIPFRSIDVQMTEADGDGLLDLVGNDRSQFSVLYQTSPRAFDQDFLLETRLPIGASFFGDLDGDARADAVVPTLLGLLILLGQEDRTLLSRVYDTPIGAPATDTRFVVTADRARILDANDVSIVVGDLIASIDSNVAASLPPWLDANALPQRIPYGRVPANDPRHTFALWNPGGSQLALYRMEGTSPLDRRPELRLTIGATDPLEEVVELADVDGDGDLDLAAGIASTAAPVAVALAGTGTAAFAPFCHLRFEVFSADTQRWIPLDAPLRRVADFDGDGIADWVFDFGVLISGGTAPSCGAPLRSSSIGALSLIERWREVELGDFNGDGRLDFATSSDERQLDVYFGSGTGGFARRTVLLEQPPIRIRAGDYDGDYLDDIALVFSGPTDLVAVVFGDAGSELSEPRAIGRFAQVTDAIAAHWAFDAESLDLVSDLLIQSRPFDSEELAIAIAYGSTSRQMFAPFSFPQSTTGAPLGAVLGDFCNCEEAGCVDQKDLAAVGRTLVPPRHELWIARGVAGEPPGRLMPEEEPILIPAAESARFELACSIWHVADVDGDPRDEIFALDHTGFGGAGGGASRLLILDPDASACGRAVSIEVRSIEQDSFTGARRIRSADLDADGDLDLLLLFAGRERLGAGLVILWNDGSFDRSTTIDAPEDPIDVDALQLDADTPLELVLRTQRDRDTGLWLLDPPYTEARAFRRFTMPPAAIAAGDLDGDGLDDLAVAGGGRVRLIWAEDAAP